MIPWTVTAIENGAFWECTSLHQIRIPRYVREIEAAAFGGCSALTDVSFDGSEIQWQAVTLGEDALPSGVTVRFLALPERTLTLPASVTTIEAEAFAGLGEGCVLAIPASVTSIADNAFSGTGIRVIAPAGSYAAQWAGEHGIACQEP